MNFLYYALAWVSNVAHAESPIRQYCEGLHDGCGAGSAFAVQLGNRVIDFISEIIGGAAVIQLIWGAIKLITAGGEEEGKTKAKTIIAAALVGIFLAIMGKSFVYFLAAFFRDNTPQA